MKVSSISGATLDAGLAGRNQQNILLQAAHVRLASLLKKIDCIGTAIALGEAGDLEAVHQFRTQGMGKNK